jgi:hypothetical protein
MRNPYKMVDDTIMYGVNKGVQAWNWTTGDTKKVIANDMLSIAPIMEISGIYIKNPLVAMALTPVMLFATHLLHKVNYYQESFEQAVKEKNIKDPRAELIKSAHAFFGPQQIAGGVILGRLSGGYEIDSLILGSGPVIRGLASYVMRADDLTPRKNVLSRSKNTLADMVKEYRAKPALQPIRIGGESVR